MKLKILHSTVFFFVLEIASSQEEKIVVEKRKKTKILNFIKGIFRGRDKIPQEEIKNNKKTLDSLDSLTEKTKTKTNSLEGQELVYSNKLNLISKKLDEKKEIRDIIKRNEDCLFNRYSDFVSSSHINFSNEPDLVVKNFIYSFTSRRKTKKEEIHKVSKSLNIFLKETYVLLKRISREIVKLDLHEKSFRVCAEIGVDFTENDQNIEIRLDLSATVSTIPGSTKSIDNILKLEQDNICNENIGHSGDVFNSEESGLVAKNINESQKTLQENEPEHLDITSIHHFKKLNLAKSKGQEEKINLHNFIIEEDSFQSLYKTIKTRIKANLELGISLENIFDDEKMKINDINNQMERSQVTNNEKLTIIPDENQGSLISKKENLSEIKNLISFPENINNKDEKDSESEIEHTDQKEQILNTEESLIFSHQDDDECLQPKKLIENEEVIDKKIFYKNENVISEKEDENKPKYSKKIEDDYSINSTFTNTEDCAENKNEKDTENVILDIKKIRNSKDEELPNLKRNTDPGLKLSDENNDICGKNEVPFEEKDEKSRFIGEKVLSKESADKNVEENKRYKIIYQKNTPNDEFKIEKINDLVPKKINETNTTSEESDISNINASIPNNTEKFDLMRNNQSKNTTSTEGRRKKYTKKKNTPRKIGNYIDTSEDEVTKNNTMIHKESIDFLHPITNHTNEISDFSGRMNHADEIELIRKLKVLSVFDKNGIESCQKISRSLAETDKSSKGELVNIEPLEDRHYKKETGTNKNNVMQTQKQDSGISSFSDGNDVLKNNLNKSKFFVVKYVENAGVDGENRESLNTNKNQIEENAEITNSNEASLQNDNKTFENGELIKAFNKLKVEQKKLLIRDKSALPVQANLELIVNDQVKSTNDELICNFLKDSLEFEGGVESYKNYHYNGYKGFSDDIYSTGINHKYKQVIGVQNQTKTEKLLKNRDRNDSEQVNFKENPGLPNFQKSLELSSDEEVKESFLKFIPINEKSQNINDDVSAKEFRLLEKLTKKDEEETKENFLKFIPIDEKSQNTNDDLSIKEFRLLEKLTKKEEERKTLEKEKKEKRRQERILKNKELSRLKKIENEKMDIEKMKMTDKLKTFDLKTSNPNNKKNKEDKNEINLPHDLSKVKYENEILKNKKLIPSKSRFYGDQSVKNNPEQFQNSKISLDDDKNKTLNDQKETKESKLKIKNTFDDLKKNNISKNDDNILKTRNKTSKIGILTRKTDQEKNGISAVKNKKPDAKTVDSINNRIRIKENLKDLENKINESSKVQKRLKLEKPHKMLKESNKKGLIKNHLEGKSFYCNPNKLSDFELKLEKERKKNIIQRQSRNVLMDGRGAKYLQENFDEIKKKNTDDLGGKRMCCSDVTFIPGDKNYQRPNFTSLMRKNLTRKKIFDENLPIWRI